MKHRKPTARSTRGTGKSKRLLRSPTPPRAVAKKRPEPRPQRAKTRQRPPSTPVPLASSPAPSLMQRYLELDQRYFDAVAKFDVDTAPVRSELDRLYQLLTRAERDFVNTVPPRAS